MVTQKGKNTFVVGIRGNFDDAQSGVKEIFGDAVLKAEMKAAGFRFSSANSINIGRLVPQIVYYVYACARLYKKGALKEGGTVNAVVPTGNFGNILAAYYAKRMGLPLGRLICASNENRVLYDFFRTGCYDRNREFILTSSPSMDILISSNLERLIYEIGGRDSGKAAALMKRLSEEGSYEITPDMQEKLGDFYGNYASEEETAAAIRRIYEKTGYVLDPHTAVAEGVYEKYRAETGDEKVTVIASTASPFKFTGSVMKGLGQECGAEDDFELADRLSGLSGTEIPGAVREIRNAEVLHHRVVEVKDMKTAVKEFLGLA